MAKFLRQLIIMLAFSVLSINAYDGCFEPTTENIILNGTLKDQYISKPFVTGQPDGTELYYKIVLPVDGQFVIESALDTNNPIDIVNTHGRLLDSNCLGLDMSNPEIHTNPRYFKYDKILSAGTYYLRVHNEASANDGGAALAKGFFQLENSFTPTVASKDFSITKTSSTTINSGSEIIYTIRVKNKGSESTTSVKITDPLPSPNHLSYIGTVGSAQWSCAGNPLVCTLTSGIINPNSTQELKLKYEADYQSYDRDVSNTTSLEVSYADVSTFNKDAAQRTIHIRKALPGIKITKSGPNSVVEGEEFDFNFRVENNGTRVTDTDVKVTGSISSDFDIVDIIYDSAIWENCSYNAAKSYSCDLKDDLSPWVNKSFKIRVKAVGDPANPEVVLHYAVVNADTVMGHVSDSDSHMVTIIAKNSVVNIAKTKSQDDVVVGHYMHYTLAVKNNGNTPLTNVHVVDNVPTQLTLKGISVTGWDCSASDIPNNKVDCTFASLGINSTKTIKVNVEGKTATTNLINTAEVTTTEGVSDDDNESINVIAQATGIRIQKSAPISVNPLGFFDYILEVDNNGAESNSDIVVTDTIDASLTLPADWDSSISAPWSCTKIAQAITCNYAGTLTGSNASAPDIVIHVQAPFNAMVIDNSAKVDSKSGNELTPVDDEDNVSTSVNTPSVHFATLKTTNKSSVKSGETYRYTIKISNDGTIQQSDIVISDIIAELIKDSFILNSGNFDCSSTVGRNIICKLATLDGGDSESFTIDITAPAVSQPTTVINDANSTAVIHKPAQADEVENSFGQAIVTINPANSSLSITKDSSQDLVLENDVFNYLISVKNNSISDEFNLTMTDDIPSDLNVTTPTGCTKSANTIKCERSLLKAGESWDINITVKAPSNIAVNKTIKNIAKVVSTKDTSGKSKRKDVELLSSNEALTISMVSTPDTVYASDSYFYRISIANGSGVDIDTVNLTETLPTELEYDRYEGGGWNCNYDTASRLFSCDNSGVKLSDTTKIIDLYVKAPNHEANVTNSISMTSSLDALTREANATTTVNAKVAKLIYTKAVSDKNIVKLGDDFTYTIRVKNDGLAPTSDINVTNLKVVFNLDQNISFKSIQTSDWSCLGSSIVTCTLPILELGVESKDINITVTSLAPKQVISIATLTADQLPQPQAKTINISVDVREVVDLDMSLQLSGSQNSVEADSIYFYDLVISNLDMNKIAKDVIVDINTTSVKDYILVNYTDTINWDCTKVSKFLSCKLKHDLLPDSTQNLRLEVKAPNIATKVELNATLYSEYVNDTNLANNSAYEDTNINITDLTGSNPREFTKVPLQGMVDMNIYGELLTIGNQSICEKDGAGNCQEPWTAINDYVTQEYANLDNPIYAGGYKTSTRARLDIDVSDEIIWAGLYWMGRIDKGIAGFQTKVSNAHKVYLRADLNSSGYIEINAQRSTDAIDNSGATIDVDKFNFINGNSAGKGSSYFDYQGMADVTSYVKANRGGDYWVGDIQSSEGDNLSAGWNLVVVVRDTKLQPTRELKNITIFDGFKGVWKEPDGEVNTIYPHEVNQTVKGFLTPATGPIKSSLIFFGFEGDKTLSDFTKVSDSLGVYHSLTNGKNPVDDVLNGTISKNGVTVSSRLPNLDNTSGIDVDEFDLGDVGGVMGTGIIDNGQTETSISIGSLGMASNNNGGDRFFLGMFGFSTNLNDPVCYMQTLKNEDFTADLGLEAHLGEKIGVEVEFRNIEIQTLRDMHSYLQIDKIFTEDEKTFELKNISEGLFTTQNSLFDFGKIDTGDDNLTEVKTSIGLGSTSAHGGDVKTGEIAYIRYNAEISQMSDDNLTHNVYYVSYAPNSNKKIMVSRCSGDDQNLTIIEHMTNGFEVTHEGGLTDGVNDGLQNRNIANPSNENHLFTQVVDQDFTIDVVVLSDSNKSEVRSSNYTGLVQVEMIEYNQSLAAMATNNYDPCSDYLSISAPQYVAINNSIRESGVFNISQANKNVGFRVRYIIDGHGKHAHWGTAANNINRMSEMVNNIYNEHKSYSDDRCKSVCIDTPDEANCRTCLFKDRDIYGGFSRSSCSTDLFSIRPKKVSFDTNETKSGNKYHIGGRDYNLTLDANASGYDSKIITATGSLDFNLTNQANCPIGNLSGSLLGSSFIKFENGDANMTNFRYDNIGDINVSFEDHNWTKYDQNLTSVYMSDCIVDSDSMIHNASHKVGCNIGGEKILSFKPARFISNIDDFNDFANNFTYISGKDNMTLSDENMSAHLSLNINAVIENNNTATHFDGGCYATDVNYTVGLNLTPLGVIPQYYDLNSSTSNTAVYIDAFGNPIFDGKFLTPESNFTSGSVDIAIGINVKRDVTKPINPFIINSNDINILVDDNGSYNIHGIDFNITQDINSTFYYGRVNIPDIETAASAIDVTVFYEVYCKGCNKTIFPLANEKESGDSVFWYINNPSHTTMLQGTFNTTTLDAKSGITCALNSFNKFNASLGALSAPHRDRISFNSSSWLIYNKFNKNVVKDSFNITFFSSTNNWAGKGNRGMTIDQNISKRNAKKMEW